ncbi:DUF484 family protein [Aliikangiella maris]|uniref:Sensor domain-containing diguanylate cyclase n=2 Tax=Aliikangiella maris TaxID=3162458 RepID=A0ABV2BQB0_9GAMM
MDNSKKSSAQLESPLANNAIGQDSNLNQLLQENRLLKTTLDEILTSAQQNQATQEKFYALELYFLESQSYTSLLDRILIDLPQRLRLVQVELFLLDSDQEIQRQMNEIYQDLDYPNLHYIDNRTKLEAYYTDGIKLNLSQDSTVIRRLFNHSATRSLSVAQLPLIRGHQLIGSLHLGSQDFNRFHAGLAVNFLQHLASIISVCIENCINQEKYVHLSLVDILTRAKNRRYFFQALAREIARASRSMSPISCLFIDIDHFKQINDQKGHLTGDLALKAVVQSISPLLRRSDVLARFGGEEFTVLLPECRSSTALEIAERIRENIQQMEIADHIGHLFSLTASLGVSTWNPQAQHLQSAEAIQNYLINTADKAVYAAKQAGRNCIKHLISA